MSGCGSCIPCVSRTGAACALGTRPPAYPRHIPPAPGTGISGRGIEATAIDSMYYGRAVRVAQPDRPPRPRDWFAEAVVDIDFEPCRRNCGVVQLHAVGTCARYRAVERRRRG